MKYIYAFLMALFAICLLAMNIVAQDEPTARDIIKRYNTPRAVGMEEMIYLQQGDELMTVDGAQSFKSGDRIKVGVRSRSAGYVYVLNTGTSGTERVLFPGRGESSRVEANKDYLFPRQYGLEMDGQAGTEVIKVLFSSEPISFLETAARRRHASENDEGVLNRAELARLNPLWRAGQEANSVVSAADLKQATDDEVQGRDPRWKKPTTLVVTRPARQSVKTPAAKPVAVYQVNLKKSG